MNRLVRIGPLCWSLILVVFAFALATPELLGGTRADGAALLRSLALIPFERWDGTMRPILFEGWSLNLEMAFFLVFALMLPLKRPGRRVAAAAGLLAVIALCGIIFKPYLSPPARFLTQPIVLEFAAVAMLGVPLLVVVTRSSALEGWPASTVAAAMAVATSVTAEKGGLAMTWPAVFALREASYALYLTHPFVTQALTISAIKLGLLQPYAAGVLAAGAVAASIAAAQFVHARGEKPLGKTAKVAFGRLYTACASEVGRLALREERR